MMYLDDSKRPGGRGGIPPLPTSKPRPAASRPRRTRKALLAYIRARLSEPRTRVLPKKGVVHLCRHIKADGAACSSPALTGRRFCFFHQEWHDSHTSVDTRIRRLERKKARLEESIRALRSLQA